MRRAPAAGWAGSNSRVSWFRGGVALPEKFSLKAGGPAGGGPALVVGLLDGSGLRLMEALRLRVKDRGLERRELTVRVGKGSNDRLTVLPQSLVPALQEHRLGGRRRHHLDPSVVQKAVKRAVLEAGVTKAAKLPHLPPFIRDTSAGTGPGHPHHPGATRPQGWEHHHDLHACA